MHILVGVLCTGVSFGLKSDKSKETSSNYLELNYSVVLLGWIETYYYNIIILLLCSVCSVVRDTIM